MVQLEATVRDPRGLHAVLAAAIASAARQYRASIQLINLTNGLRAGAGSVLEILCLDTARDTRIRVLAQGPDERSAADRIAGLVSSDLYHR